MDLLLDLNPEMQAKKISNGALRERQLLKFYNSRKDNVTESNFCNNALKKHKITPQ